MAANEDLERRVAALEAAVAELQRRSGIPATMAEWLKQRAFTSHDDEAFEEMVRLGREFREADRPQDDEEEAR